jgi:hypothetical protein
MTNCTVNAGIVIWIMTNFANPYITTSNIEIRRTGKGHHVVGQDDSFWQFFADGGGRNRLKKVCTVSPVTNQLDITPLAGMGIVTLPTGDIP